MLKQIFIPMARKGALGLAIGMLAFAAAAIGAEDFPTPHKVCIAHRGASGYAPEHTIASYTKAIEMKAEFVEQDLAITKDGVLVCIHDSSLERTTNVAQIFPNRNFAPDPRGQNKKTWRVVDFTLAELKRLDAGSHFDGSFSEERIPTFQEAIELVKGKAGLYPELKDPDFYKRQGFDMEKMVLDILKRNGLETAASQGTTPIFIQSFSPDSLKRFKELAGDSFKLVQLVSDPQAKSLLGEVGITQVRKYADGVGPSLTILHKDKDAMKRIKGQGLLCHPYTVRLDNFPETYHDATAYMRAVLNDLGTDGCFTDYPDLFPR